MLGNAFCVPTSRREGYGRGELAACKAGHSIVLFEQHRLTNSLGRISLASLWPLDKDKGGTKT